MSLQYWFPLTEDLHNQGVASLSNINVTAATTIATNGKLGNCYTNTGTTANIANTASFSAEKFSACAWVRINTSRTNWCRAFGMAGTGTYFGLGCEHSNGTLLGFHFYKTIDGTNTAIFDDYPVTKQIGVWVHYTMTYDGIHAYFYENGTLIKTYNVASARQNTKCEMTTLYLFGGTSGNYSQCSLNDVRIYDHCLSAEEVREIANGLVLHYKLDGDNFGNPNLVTGSNTASTSTNTWNLSMQTGDKTNTIEYEGGTPLLVITRGSTAQSGWRFLSYNSLNRTAIKTSTTYTVSFDMKSSSAGTISLTGFVQSNATNYMTNSTTVIQGTVKANQWNHIVLQCTTKDDFSGITISGQIVYLAPSDALFSVGNIMKFKNIKVEEGAGETPWCPADNEMSIDRTKIIDSSGYHHHGSTLNTVSISNDTSRYNNSTNLSAGNSAINCGRGGMVTDSITVNFWLKSSSWANPISCTEGGGWNFEASGDYFRFPIYISGVGYKYGASSTTKAQICNNQWHMLTGMYDRLNQKVKIYVDGQLDNDYNAATSNVIQYANNVIWLGAEAGGSQTAIASNGMIGLFSDLRIYCTALPDSEILKLYNSGMVMDKNKSIHTHKFNDYSTITTLEKTAILNGQLNETLYCPYDPEVYIEPDGSKWIHIFHQNNASSNLFSSTDTFTSSVYKSANAWFYVSLCNLITSWEFLGVNAEESTSTVKRYRWIQPVNPMTAAFADVAAANITRYTDGYTSSSWGGLYKKNSSTYLCLNNAQSGNWWGAIGAWALSASGVPALTGTVTKTGYIDLYVRVDNTELTNIALAKNIGWLTNQAIEK